MYYDKKLDSYTTKNNPDSKKNDHRNISGTEAREMLSKGIPLPEWYMRRELTKAVIDEIRKNVIVFEK